MIKTYYPHWGQHTAFNAFLKYFDGQRFKVTIQNIPMGNERFSIPLLRQYCRGKIKKKGIREYKLNDLAAEISIFFNSLFKKVDIVHMIDAEHSLMFLPYWYEKSGFLKSFPKIVAMFHQPPAILETLINVEIVKQVDQVLVVSPSQVAYFQQYLPPERVHTILLGVDTDHFKPFSGKKEKKLKKFKCLAGGVWLRDYDAIFKTAALLQKIPEIEFHIVAPQIDNPANKKNIIFHENLPDAALLQLYQTSDVLFLPLQDATANTFLLEGCACGLPIVSSDLPSVKTYFPGEEAILIQNNEPEAFAKTLTDLYDDPRKHFSMAKAARKRALELSWDKITREYERMYMNL
jgi:glycosyltransferase involved in cell wall biosynthesis